jgi:hypothetical protein
MRAVDDKHQIRSYWFPVPALRSELDVIQAAPPDPNAPAERGRYCRDEQASRTDRDL